jgi:hypothetical protein
MSLVELLKRHEGKTLEFKRDLSSGENILKCLIAFANTAGGSVVSMTDRRTYAESPTFSQPERSWQTWSQIRSTRSPFGY